jgi:hypothetical protein
MTHVVDSDEFWPKYYALPKHIQVRADRRYRILKKHPDHRGLAFEKRCDTSSGALYKANVNRQYRALALEVEPNVYSWFWIGKHDEYERLLDLFC